MSRAWEVKRLDPDAPLSLNARRVLAVRIGEFYSWAPIVDDDEHAEALHQLRISAKRLRYTLELFRELFGEAGERNIARVRDLQEVLGAFHDQEVRIALIKDELGRLANEHAAAPVGAGDPIGRAGSGLSAAPEEARPGLTNLLARQNAARLVTLAEVRALWTAQNAPGMREDLVALSALQIPVPPSST